MRNASQNCKKNFKDLINELWSNTVLTRSNIDFEVNIEKASEKYLSENQGFIAKNNGKILATGKYDKS